MAIKRFFLISAILVMVLTAAPSVQSLQLQSQQTFSTFFKSGQLELSLMLRRLNTVGIFMMATAHPDDEDNALLTMLSRGEGIQTRLVTATRGDGGQNEIGSELFDALAVLRTEELLAAHKLDGAEQYFTRAMDFGYSFSTDETFEKWGRREILGDFVRIIRTIRPDVITGLPPEGQGGGQHHQASAALAHEAFWAAADPTQFPEQITEGLRPWQSKKFYFRDRFGFQARDGSGTDSERLVTIDVGQYDSLLGRTYAEIGSLARSMHKCQGMNQLVPLPGPTTSTYRLAENVIENQVDIGEVSLFDGVDATIDGLVQYAGSYPPKELISGLASISRHVATASQSFHSGFMEQTAERILAGLQVIRDLRSQLTSMALGDLAKFEIDFRLNLKEKEFEQAAILAHSVLLQTHADDGLVTRNQQVTISAVVANHGESDVSIKGVTFSGLVGADLGCEPDLVQAKDFYNCSLKARIPTNAKLTGAHFKRLSDAARYVFEPDVPFGLPFRPSPFRAIFELELASVPVSIEMPIRYSYEADIFSGEKRMELQVVPRFAVSITPEIIISPIGMRDAQDVQVTVKNGHQDSVEGSVTLDLPDGWHALPRRAPISFSREDEERTVRFAVSPDADILPGEYQIQAIVESAEQRFTQGYQVIEYPHTQRRHLLNTSESVLKVIDVQVEPDLIVGYIRGTGDEVPAAIMQLGARVEMLDANALAWGDLSSYDVIMTGVRAYEVRDDLKAHNNRLIDYVKQGGTLIVQYNRFDFNDAEYGPYPVQVSRNRVTDENVPVELLVPDHEVFTFPNQIDEATWEDWVQERGLYFLGQKDSAYTDLVQLEDSFAFNRGVKRGVLVEARSEQGRWLYVGLGLWRQFPAGTTGAYELLANLISLGRAQDE